jgi:diguanylate cyclase (GGDEF)-like protein/PAS domain S-box-containing protein
LATKENQSSLKKKASSIKKASSTKKSSVKQKSSDTSNKKYQGKTKDHLIKELSKLRRRIAQCEKVETKHEVVQAKLSEQLDFIQLLLDAIPNPVFFKNTEGKYMGCNNAFKEFLGKSTEEIVGKTVYDMGPKEIADKYFEKDRELFENPGKQIYEWKVKTKDGEIRDVIFHKATFMDVKKKVSGLIGVISDITARKKAEEALRESEERLRTLYEATFEGIVIHDKGRILDANSTFAEMYGYALSELIGMNGFDLVAEESRQLVKEHVLSQYELPYEAVGLKKDGTTFFMESHGKKLLYKGREVRVAAMRDITERKQAEVKTRESEERYRSLVESTEDSIYVVDRNYKYLFMNRNHITRMGISENEYRGHAYDEFHSPEDTKWFVENVDKVFATGKSIKHEHKSHRDGRYYLQTLSPVKKADGEIIAVTVISMDINELKTMEKKLHSLSITDELTGVFNRRGFFALADQHIKFANRHKKGIFMLYADLDGLKKINDTSGHKEGDLALIELANLLKENYRDSDVIARIGGDEFVVIPVGTNEDNLEIITARFQNALNIHNEKMNRNFRLSASIGIAYYDPEKPCSLDELLLRADRMMYEKKKHHQK